MSSEITPNGPWPLTEAQEGLWYAQRLDPSNPSFNCGHALWIDGPLDLEAFRAAATQGALECQSLSLAMRETPEGVRQWVDASRAPQLEVVDLAGAPDALEKARAAMSQDMQTAIDPLLLPLARQMLFKLGAQAHCWYQRSHHLCTDGYAMALWSQRVAELYAHRVAGAPERAPLAPLAGVIADDAAYRSGAKRTADAAYWRERFSPAPEVVGLASGRAVRASLVTVLTLDFVLTVAMWGITPTIVFRG